MGDPFLPAQPLHLAEPPMDALDHLMTLGPGLGALRAIGYEPTGGGRPPDR
jgi:hypothetical protein